MRIAFVIPKLHGGGAEFVAGQWALALGAEGHEVDIVTTHEKERTEAQRADAPFRHVRLGGGLSFFHRVRALRSLMLDRRYDVVMGLMPHWNVLALLAAASLRGRRPRVVISGRNVESSLKRSLGTGYRVELLIARRIYRRADAYVAISHPVAAEAITAYGLEPSRVFVIPNPASAKTDLEQARRARESRATVEREAELHVVVPGRLVEQKRPLLALETARALIEDESGSGAVVVHYFGSGPYQPQIEAAAARLDVSVVFHGWVESWFEEAPAGSVMLLPSHSEGFGNVFVESAAYGIPTVATSRALGIADAIAPGLTGEIAVEDDAFAFARAVRAASRLRVPVDLDDWLRHFSRDHSATELLRVFDRITDVARPRTSALPMVRNGND